MELRLNIDPVCSNQTGYDFFGRPLTIKAAKSKLYANSNLSDAPGTQYFLDAQKIRRTTTTEKVGRKQVNKRHPTRWVYKVYKIDPAIIKLLALNGKKIVQKKVNHTYFYDIVALKD